MKRASDYNGNGASHASVYGVQLNTPIEVVPALQHYRLVHESPSSTLDTIKYVKIFEYVKGAHIKGDGIIEIPIMVISSQRQIIYRQQSINGEFIVPYPTDININGIHTGKYIISGTFKEINVTEQQVLQGQDIQ
jgi:dolichyl-diphosphooligosaccharide--protein glycosyltransferase